MIDCSTLPSSLLDDLLIWQLADSAFPSGSLAHSGALESSWQAGQTDATTLEGWIQTQLAQTARAALPFVAAAFQDSIAFPDLDRRLHIFLNNPVANRASRAQGKAFVAAASQVFDLPDLHHLREQIRSSPAHLATAFGATLGILRCDARKAGPLFLFIALRGWLSAAIRLGIIGPLRAQRLQVQMLPQVQLLAASHWDSPIAVAAHTAPLLDILQAGHDRLYSRLFQS